MSSTIKTANLGLNIWGAGDVEQAADLNADNVKIDAAYGNIMAGAASPLVKLVDICLYSGSAAFELDMSGIDIDAYLELIFSLRLGRGSELNMCFNNTVKLYHKTTPSLSTTVDYMTLGTGINRLTISDSIMVFRTERLLQLTTMNRLSIPKVNTINLYNTLNAFLSEDHLIIWGLRK